MLRGHHAEAREFWTGPNATGTIMAINLLAPGPFTFQSYRFNLEVMMRNTTASSQTVLVGVQAIILLLDIPG